MQMQNSTQNWFTGKRGRDLKEALTAYLMISPAVFLIFLFGIFPVFFAVYVSMHKWQLVRGEFRGLRNYLAAIDNLMYIALFFLGILSFYLVFLTLRGLFNLTDKINPSAWLLIVPAAGIAGSVLAFFRWAFFQLPGFLDIARNMRGEERSRELFVRLLQEAFLAENVYPYWQAFTQIFYASLFLTLIAILVWRRPEYLRFQFQLTTIWIAAAVGIGFFYVTFNAIGDAYAAAVETGEDPGIWPQFIMVTAGVLLLFIGWRIWRSAEKQISTPNFIFRIIAATAFLVGAVLLIIEIPTIVASGDPDLWQGLKVTVFFSIGTVPFQLGSALFLSVLLFQKLKGSEAFRIIFFIPYITPAVASAAVFKQIFSNRPISPANSFIGWLGSEPLDWLWEPDGLFTIISRYAGIDIPSWAAGPSLALSIIILHSIWIYVGYNTVIYLAGLGNIPYELTEAAEIDGANRWNVFRYITFPLLSPTTYFLSLLAIIGTFKAFNTIWVMRSGAALGTTDPFSVVIFIEFFQKTRYGYASALAFVLFAIILSLTFINNKIQGSRVFYG